MDNESQGKHTESVISSFNLKTDINPNGVIFSDTEGLINIIFSYLFFLFVECSKNAQYCKCSVLQKLSVNTHSRET